ncbi:hypothetical protein BH10PSE6_BH10PSE6_09790 [soil metagenome]
MGHSIGAAHDPSAPAGHLPTLRVGRKAEARSGFFVRYALGRRRAAGSFRSGALLGFLLRCGFFGVLDRLQAVALATFEFVVRLACHGAGLFVAEGIRVEGPLLYLQIEPGASIKRSASGTGRLNFSSPAGRLPRPRAATIGKMAISLRYCRRHCGPALQAGAKLAKVDGDLGDLSLRDGLCNYFIDVAGLDNPGHGNRAIRFEIFTSRDGTDEAVATLAFPVPPRSDGMEGMVRLGLRRPGRRTTANALSGR